MTTASLPTAAAASESHIVPGLKTNHVSYFADQGTFEAAFPGLLVEDFEAGTVNPGNIVACPAPLDETSNNACFAAGGILPGLQFTDAPGPDTIDGLVLLGAGASLNPSKAIIANTFDDAFEILFDPPVSAAGMDLHSTPGPGAGPPDTVTITIFDTTNAVLDTVTADASGPGNFWGFASTTTAIISRIRIFSDNNRAEGVDNVQFVTDPILLISAVDTLDRCRFEPATQNGLSEPGETITLNVELTAVAGGFTGIRA